jgi:hypothetical protein
MIAPSLILGFVIASLYGLVFYLFFGQGWLRFILYWVVAITGFIIGHLLANLLGLSLFNIGELNFVEGTLVSWACLFAARSRR